MFSYLEHFLISYAAHVHLAIFAPIASFIEEIIPPIPSPSIVIATGSMAQVQGYLFYSLFFLALLAALGKTLGASVIYYVADRAEDILAGPISRFLGITHKQIESFGARLSKDWKDYIVLTVLRALPVVPSSLISVGSGLLKINFRLFIISTFIGSAIRDFIYIYLGYAGTKYLILFFKKTATSIESNIQLAAIVIIVIFLGFLYYRRYQANKIKK